MEYKSGWSKKQVLLLVLVNFDTYLVILHSYSMSTLMSTHSLSYVKDNDHKYGVIVTICNSKILKVISL